MLKNDSLLRMAEIRSEWCVSIYLPLGDTNTSKKKNRLKKLTLEAGKKLKALGAAPLKVGRILGPVDMILDNPGFWENRTEGIAAFFTTDSFAWHSLQYQFDELVVVTDRFHLKPLLRNAAQKRRFYLLVLSEEQIRFFEASELGISEPYIKGLPRNAAAFLNPRTEESSVGEEEKQARLLELFQKVDKAVTGHLKDDDAPLILAGEEQLHPVYYDANTYPHLVKIGIGGNADKLTAKELLEKALPIIKPVFRRRREKALSIFHENIGTGLASNNFAKIFNAARNGRIATLFVPVGKQKWGRFDNQTNELEFNEEAKPGDKDLLCVASTRTLRSGGEVFVVLPEQMPNNSLIAAVLRN
jgi:hypothetical protein